VAPETDDQLKLICDWDTTVALKEDGVTGGAVDKVVAWTFDVYDELPAALTDLTR
jgi:hypothetical protein